MVFGLSTVHGRRWVKLRRKISTTAQSVRNPSFAAELHGVNKLSNLTRIHL